LTAPAAEAVDPSWKALYRWGGILLMIAGLLDLLVIALFLPLVSSITTGDAALKNLAGQALLAQIAFGIDGLDVLFTLPAVLALYLALKGINRNAMLVAAASLGVFTALHLSAVPSTLSLVTLSQNYAAATSDAQRAAYAAVSNYVYYTTVTLEPIYILVASIGILIIGFVMLKGIFSRGVAYLGIAAGILGIVLMLGLLVPALLTLDIVFLLLVAIWNLLVGFKLYRLGRS